MAQQDVHLRLTIGSVRQDDRRHTLEPLRGHKRGAAPHSRRHVRHMYRHARHARRAMLAEANWRASPHNALPAPPPIRPYEPALSYTCAHVADHHRAPLSITERTVFDGMPPRAPSLLGRVPTGEELAAKGRAITRMAIRLRADELPRTCITDSPLAPLVNLERMLPSLTTEKANHKRQKPRDGTMWPALISSDDFGALWFSTTVFAVVKRVVNDGGDNYLFLELKRPSEKLVADLVRWVVATGFPLKHFVHEFSTAAAKVISADSRHDNFVLSALLEVCRQQYSATAAAWTHIADDPQSHTTRGLLEVLRRRADLAIYTAAAREDDRDIYPTDLKAYAHWSAPRTADSDNVYNSDGGRNHGNHDLNSDIDADYSDYTHNSEAPSATASGAAAGSEAPGEECVPE
ncbi:hypothetical protein JKP88DRAFT_248409 [Tribonema minus]|uniref:Uncharacterized protein n=1 Tax=Tribonema minus TaxID=303371 RepID=A0A835YVM6_9STRA|nr:hypothetical protein JKP88DRAFT_248409 [Tribonema minus]